MSLRPFFLDRLPFRDRIDAGAHLAESLLEYRGEKPVVLGIPRGGVVVAAEVARRLNGELDVTVARKLGSPFSPELAIGAVTADGGRFLNENLIHELRVDDAYLEQVTTVELNEARRREQRFRGAGTRADVKDRIVLLIDDGLATGATMRAALRSLRSRGAKRLIVAVPVGSREACLELEKEADEVVCLAQPVPFGAVGRHYEHFEPVEDATVFELLRAPPTTHSDG